MEIRNEFWFDCDKFDIDLMDKIVDMLMDQIDIGTRFGNDLLAEIFNDGYLEDIHPMEDFDDEFRGCSPSELFNLFNDCEGDYDEAVCFSDDCGLTFYNSFSEVIQEEVCYGILLEMAFNNVGVNPLQEVVDEFFLVCSQEMNMDDFELDKIFDGYIEEKGDDFYLDCIEHFLNQYGIEFADSEELSPIDFWLSQF